MRRGAGGGVDAACDHAAWKARSTTDYLPLTTLPTAYYLLLTTYLRARGAEDLDVPVLPNELGVAGVDQVQDVARLHDSDELRLCCDSHRAGLGSVGVVQYSRVIVEYSTVQYCAVCIV